MSATLPITPAERFASIIDGLCRAVAEAGGRRLVAGPLVILIWSRLRRLAVAVVALTARIEAGRHRRFPARRRPRPAARRPARRDLPHGPLWLVRLVPQASAYGSQLQHLLADPEFAALAETVPQMRRLLRPLSRMLGVRLPRQPAVAAPPDIPAPATPAPADPLAPLAPWPRPPDLPPMGLPPVRPAARPPPKPA